MPILVHTFQYSRLKNRLYRFPPKKDNHVYIARSTYHYAYARQTQVICEKETKKIIEDERKERRCKKAIKRKIKGKKIKDKTRKNRRDQKRKQGKEKR